MPLSNSYIAILDIGHGNCTVLFEHGNSYIIDCGPGSSVLEFLTSEGITNIETIFLSHADQDHIEGLVGLLSFGSININSVYVNSDGLKKSALWDDLIYTLSKSSTAGGTKLHVGITHTQGNFSCGSLLIETIGPSAYLAAKSPGGVDRQGRKITSNSISASFRIFWKESPIAYLAGDIDQIALDDLKDHNISIIAPLLVFPHHGGYNSGNDIVTFTNELCDMCNFQTAIFSIGRNKHSNPLPQVVKAVRSKIKNVRIACTQLSKNCANTLNGTPLTHLNSAFARGRTTNECCSGSFIIELSHATTYSPDFKAHQNFILAAATTPLCFI